MLKIFNVAIKNKLSKFSRGFMNHVKNDTVPVSFFYSDQFQIFSLYNLDHLKTKNQNFLKFEISDDFWFLALRRSGQNIKKARI